MKYLNVIRKEKGKTVEFILESIRGGNTLILNLGSGCRTYGMNCVNMDIQGGVGVNVIGDAHQLPFTSESFNICVLSAVLQYCEDPFQVAKEVHRILLKEGMVITDAPFVQHYCLGTPDLYRFSRDGLSMVFSKYFDIIQCGVSIGGGSSLAFYLQGIVSVCVSNRYLRGILTNLVSFIVYPLSFLQFKNRHEIAGAFVLLGKKKGGMG